VTFSAIPAIAAARGATRSDLPFPPGVEEFYPPSLIDGTGYWLTKFTVLVWLAVAMLIVFFLLAYRSPKMVPTKGQWIAESVYGFTRNNVATELIGHEGVRFAPYITTLFSFLLLTNIFAIVPGIQVSPNSHIAFPAFLAVITYVLFNYMGIRRHGFLTYMKHSLIPPAPWYVLWLLIPIEFVSTFLIRPFTLAVRLFANMFAGHVILLVFTLGGFVLLQMDSWYLKPISLLSWALAIALTFLEAFVAILQAYVFVVLTSSYLQGALAEEH
jgi:F-type H+-transporting ATPase subunit a